MTESLWEAIRLLTGSRDDRLEFLRRMAVDDNAGTRCAAAAALSDLGDTVTLAERLEVEENEFVQAVLRAHFRTLIARRLQP